MGRRSPAAAALKNIEIFKRENLVEQSADKGEYLKKQLDELRTTRRSATCAASACCAASKSSRTRRPRRSSVATTSSPSGSTIWSTKRGLLSRVWDTIHFAPPLVITTDEIDRMVAIADEALTIG